MQKMTTGRVKGKDAWDRAQYGGARAMPASFFFLHVSSVRHMQPGKRLLRAHGARHLFLCSPSPPPSLCRRLPLYLVLQYSDIAQRRVLPQQAASCSGTPWARAEAGTRPSVWPGLVWHFNRQELAGVWRLTSSVFPAKWAQTGLDELDSRASRPFCFQTLCPPYLWCLFPPSCSCDRQRGGGGGRKKSLVN